MVSVNVLFNSTLKEHIAQHCYHIWAHKAFVNRGWESMYAKRIADLQPCQREPFPSKLLWMLGAPKRAGSPPIDSFVIKQTKMWAGIRKLELPYRDSVATSPPITFQSCLAIFKSNTRLSLGLESQSLKEHSIYVSCHIVMLHSQLAIPWILKYHISSGWDCI